MFKQIFRNLPKLSKTFFLLFFLTAGFFGFGLVKSALASCTYSITRFDTGSQTSLGPNDKVTFYGTVKRTLNAANANQLNDCNNDSVGLSIYLQGVTGTYGGNYEASFNGLSGGGNAYKLNFSPDSSDAKSGLWNFTASMDLSPVASQLTNNNQLVFGFKVYSYSFNSTQQTTWKVSYSYTGAVTNPNLSGGQRNLNLQFNPAGPYTQNQKFSVSASLSQADLNGIGSLDSSITSMIMETRVNNAVVGSYTIQRSWLNSGPVKQDNVTVTSPPFSNTSNTNTVVVNFLEPTTKVVVATGQGRVDTNLAGTGNVTNNPPQPVTSNPTATSVTPNPPIGQTSGADCTGPNPDPRYCVYNPLPTDKLTDMVVIIMKAFLGIIAVWAVVFVVIGGFKMVMSQGNEEAYTTAKKTITWAILGLVIALLSFAIIAMVQNFLGTDIKPM